MNNVTQRTFTRMKKHTFTCNGVGGLGVLTQITRTRNGSQEEGRDLPNPIRKHQRAVPNRGCASKISLLFLANREVCVWGGVMEGGVLSRGSGCVRRGCHRLSH